MTNNGLEFNSKEFDNFCKDEDIVKCYTIIHITQKNGVDDRMNITLLQRSWGMFSHSNLDTRY